LRRYTKVQVQTVRDWYVESFDELKRFPEIKSMEDEAKFTELIKSVMDRHNNVVPMIARGVLELKLEMASQGGGARRGGMDGRVPA
jgi:pyruvate dehydrogenase kinase 2/3/4